MASMSGVASGFEELEFDGLDFKIERTETKAFGDIGIDFAESSYGSFRILQLVSKVFEAASKVFTSSGIFLADLARSLKGVWGGLGITHLPKATKEAMSTLKDWDVSPKNPVCSDPERTMMDKCKNLLDVVGAYAYASAFLFKGRLSSLGDSSSFLGDLCDAKAAFQDLQKAEKFHSRAQELNNTFFQARFQDAKIDAMLRAVKAIAGIAGTALGILGVFFGCSVSPLLLLSLGILSCSSAIAHHFFTKSREVKVVKFFA